MAESGHMAIYFSGEEATAQVRLRAERLGLASAPVGLAAETSLSNILKTLDGTKDRPELIIIDSIQTLWSDALESAPGTVSQVRACAQALVRHAKRSGATLVLVGHVTKDGQIAGPKVVEHMVDTVLYFEGDGAHQYRILRAVKNRFGPSDEIGVFEMRSDGLREVSNPSELFLGERDNVSPGAAVFAGMEGTRPVLVEIQALVAPSPLGTPRRAVVGWDSSRLAMILAVLDTRCGLQMGAHDVYLNVAGGLKNHRSCSRPRRRGGFGLLLHQYVPPFRRNLFRRGKPVRRHSARRAHGVPPEGSRKAGVQSRLRSRPGRVRR